MMGLGPFIFTCCSCVSLPLAFEHCLLRSDADLLTALVAHEPHLHLVIREHMLADRSSLHSIIKCFTQSSDVNNLHTAFYTLADKHLPQISNCCWWWGVLPSKGRIHTNRSHTTSSSSANEISISRTCSCRVHTYLTQNIDHIESSDGFLWGTLWARAQLQGNKVADDLWVV